jgi:hypothetical protein
VQFLLEIFEIFDRDTLYMYLKEKLFFTKTLFLIQELWMITFSIMNLG